MPLPLEKPLSLKGPHGRLAAIHHDAPSDRCVILAHGFSGTKVESGRLFVTTARALAAAGISGVRFDFWGSGDSAGEFNQMTPNTEIADLHAVIAWAARRWKRVGVLGLSMGGGVSICTCADRRDVAALVTWSSVPSFRAWRNPRPAKIRRNDPSAPGRRFWTDRPSVDIPEAYGRIALPKLQIQGDCDLEGFREGFTSFFGKPGRGKRHVVLAGADHVFTQWPHRRKVIDLTVRWFKRWL